MTRERYTNRVTEWDGYTDPVQPLRETHVLPSTSNIFAQPPLELAVTHKSQMTRPQDKRGRDREGRGEPRRWAKTENKGEGCLNKQKKNGGG